jgi:hypothetical protein
VEIYTLTIIIPLYSGRNQEWQRVIEIHETDSLYDLHSYIQRITEFDNDHLYLFFAGRSHTNKKIFYSDGPANPYDPGKYINVKLNQVYPIKGLKLYYIFDFGDNWVFEIRKSRKKKVAEVKLHYPRIITQTGKTRINMEIGLVKKNQQPTCAYS